MNVSMCAEYVDVCIQWVVFVCYILCVCEFGVYVSFSFLEMAIN